MQFCQTIQPMTTAEEEENEMKHMLPMELQIRSKTWSGALTANGPNWKWGHLSIDYIHNVLKFVDAI